MTILFICDEYPPCKHGGIGSVTQTLAREMVKQGHDVVVCGFYPYYRTAKSFEEDQGVKVYRKFYGSYTKLKLSRHKIIGNFINIKREFSSYLRCIEQLIDKHKVEIIERPDFNEAFRYSGPKFIKYPQFKAPSIVKLHGNFSMVAYLQSSKYNPCIFEKERYNISSSDGIISVSNYMKNLTTKMFDLEREIEVIHNGIETGKLRDQIISSTWPLVIYAGRLSKEKGVIDLLRAWALVREKNNTARLELYGQMDMQSEKEIASLIDLSVTIHGFITKEQLLTKYEKASCAIFPSHFETFGMAPLEAMSVGCPVIYTRSTTGSEIIEDGVDGMLIEPHQISDISNALNELLSNETLSKEIGKNGYNKVVNKFSITTIALQHVEYYKNKLANV